MIGIMPFTAGGQKRLTTFGFQLKTIIPQNPLVRDNTNISNGDIRIEINPSSGIGFGMVVRRNFNERWGFETGMHTVVRRFSFDQTKIDSGWLLRRPFQINAFEVPVLGMINAQLGEEWFLSGSAGGLLNILGSEVGFDTEFEESLTVYNLIFLRRTRIVPAFMINLGGEYRNRKSGIFYLGFTYQRPFYTLYRARNTYLLDGEFTDLDFDILGDYLSLDIRYFLPDKKAD